jgi:hypothetical protein
MELLGQTTADAARSAGHHAHSAIDLHGGTLLSTW